MRKAKWLCLPVVLIILALLFMGQTGEQEHSEEQIDVPVLEAEQELTEMPESEEPEPAEPEDYDFTCVFAGDINLADDWNTMAYYDQQEGGIRDCIGEELIQTMQEADLTCVNLEFCLSDRGTPMEGKLYTFRAGSERVSILHELGVDLANLANNHIYDYGRDAFLDTLSILQEEQIAYVGAGQNAAEAEAVWYTELDGQTVAVVSATRAEKYILTPEAGEETPGVFRCYDMGSLLETVEEARANADVVIAYIHWGTEYSEELESAQTEGARALIDAGADVVLGAHPHCLQGMDFYKGKPILYSLGNYWFNEKTLDTVLVKLHGYGREEERHMEVELFPARQEGHVTRLLTDEEEIKAWRSHMEAMEPGTVWIDERAIW